MSNHLKWNRPKLSGFTWLVTRCQLNSISFVVSKQQRPHWWRTIKGCSSRTCFFKRESLLISFSSKHTLSQYLHTTWVWYWVWAPTAFWNAILIYGSKIEHRDLLHCKTKFTFETDKTTTTYKNVFHQSFLVF